MGGGVMKMKGNLISSISIIFILLVSMAMTGCAHNNPISITAKDIEVNINKKYPFSIGYIISDSQIKEKVITLAGGGDKVEYYPYKDMVSPLHSLLERSFLNARRLQSLQHSKDYEDIFLILETTIKTDSTSDSFMFWPPEQFNVNLSANVYDNEYNKIFKTKATGFGTATREEWMTDDGFAGKRAMEMALKDLIKNNDILPDAEHRGI